MAVTLGDEILNLLREHLMVASSINNSTREVTVACACGHESEGELKSFTRETDDMNEVLADFIGHPVSVYLPNGDRYMGTLEVDPDEWSDGYKVGDHLVDKRYVTELVDEQHEHADAYRIHARHQATLVHLAVVKRMDELLAFAAKSGRALRESEND